MIPTVEPHWGQSSQLPVISPIDLLNLCQIIHQKKNSWMKGCLVLLRSFLAFSPCLRQEVASFHSARFVVLVLLHHVWYFALGNMNLHGGGPSGPASGGLESSPPTQLPPALGITESLVEVHTGILESSEEPPETMCASRRFLSPQMVLYGMLLNFTISFAVLSVQSPLKMMALVVSFFMDAVMKPHVVLTPADSREYLVWSNHRLHLNTTRTPRYCRFIL
jgi:hypothetical protein